MSRWCFVLVVALASCDGGEEDVEVEGDDGGECSDGADNDQDGYFDCQDNGCWNSPDCEEADADTDADTDSDTDADTDADTDSDTDADTDSDTDADTDSDTDADPVAAHLTAVELTYDLTIDFDDSLCGLGVCDCAAHYEGDGAQYEAVGTRTTFVGTWKYVSSDCNPTLKPESFIWTAGSGTAYHTFVFDGGLTQLDDWIAHRDAEDTTPMSDPSKNGQFYITGMGESYDDGTKYVYHTESETDMSSGSPTTYTHEVQVQFNP